MRTVTCVLYYIITSARCNCSYIFRPTTIWITSIEFPQTIYDGHFMFYYRLMRVGVVRSFSLTEEGLR